MEVVHLGKIVGHVSRPRSSSAFTARGLSGNTDEKADWRQRCCGASGAYALGPDNKKKKKKDNTSKQCSVTLMSRVLEAVQNSVSTGTAPCSCTLRIVRYDIYLMQLGFHPVAVVRTLYTEGTNSRLVYIRRNSTDHTTHKIERKLCQIF